MRRGIAGVAAAALLWSCAGAGIERAALPDAPLAFVHRSETQAQERSELLARRRNDAPRGAREGTARLEDVSALLGVARSPTEQRAAMLGRLSFFDLRSGKIEPAPFALPGARPLDWTADRGRLLFVSTHEGSPQIYEWRREKDTLRTLTRGPHAHPAGCYGPDGRIAYVELRRGPEGAISRVHVTGLGGQGSRALTPGPTDGRPAWSPDGSLLIYEVDPHLPRARLAAVDPAGGEPRWIARGRQPVFTPDGQWVVYSARVRDGWRLRRMRPDGSGKREFGSGLGDESDPTVSPDGRYVVYVSEEGDRQRLRLRALDGTGDRPLQSHGDGLDPAWN